MAIELDLKIGDGTASNLRLVQMVADELKARFPKSSATLSIECNPAEALDRSLGGASSGFRLALDENGEVQVLCYSIGPEEAFGEDGGWWVCVSVLIRSPKSTVLLIVTAACLAKMTETQVVDESLLLGRGHSLRPETLLEIVGSSTELSLEDAAANVVAAIRRRESARHVKLR
jgi:hypothetical protein